MSSPVYSLLRTDAYNAPLNDVQSSNVEGTTDPRRAGTTTVTQLNPMLSRGLYSFDSLRSDQVLSNTNPGLAATTLPSALVRDAHELRNRISSLHGSKNTYSNADVETLLSELKTLQSEIDQRKKIEQERIGSFDGNRPKGGINRMIADMESEMVEMARHDTWLRVANTPYALAHNFTHRWTGIGNYLKMDMFSEPLTSLVEEQKKRIDSLRSEKKYRESLIASLSSSSNELTSLVAQVENVSNEIKAGNSPGTIAASSSKLREQMSKALSFLEAGVLQEDRDLKSVWDESRKKVTEGLKKLNEEADMAVATTQAVEKTVVIGGAITATAATGGLLAPLAGMAVGSGSSVLMSGVHIAASGGSINLEEERAKVLDDVKDSILYSLGGGISRVGMTGFARTTAMSTLGRVLPQATIRNLTQIKPGVFFTGVGILNRAGSALYHSAGGLIRNNFISHARTGMIVELPAAAWDTWKATGTQMLDPTGRLREMGVSESSLKWRYFTHRIGSAGVGGALGSCTMGLRNMIGGVRVGTPSVTQRLNPIDFVRRRLGDATAIPDLYAQSVLGVWSDYRLTGWFYGVDIDPTGEERSRMIRQAITSGMAGRFGSTALNQGLRNIETNRLNGLTAERDVLDTAVRNQYAQAGRNFNREVVLASTPGGSEFGITTPTFRRDLLAFQLDSRLPLVPARAMSQNQIMSRAAHTMYSDTPNFTPFTQNRAQIRQELRQVLRDNNNFKINPDSADDVGTSNSRLLQERRGMGLAVESSAERRASRLLVLDRDANNPDTVAYGKQYINDYINELPRDNGMAGAGWVRNWIERSVNPYGRYTTDLNSARLGLNDAANVPFLKQPTVYASNVLLKIENKVRNAANTGISGWMARTSANTFRAAADYAGGLATAWIVAPSASIYASWGVMFSPTTLTPIALNTVGDYVANPLRAILSRGVARMAGERRANPLELGELYVKFHEGRALRRWANEINQNRPGSIDANILNQLDESIQRTEALFDQGNRSRLFSYDKLMRANNDNNVVMQNQVRREYDRIIGREMFAAMQGTR